MRPACALTRNRPWSLFLLLITAVLFLGGMSHAQVMTPYLQAPTPTSIWISWQSTSGTDSTVRYGLTSGSLTSTATGTAQTLGTNYNWHAVQLTNLTPNTYYYYTVTTGTQTSAVKRFRTVPALGTNTGNFRVLVAGDNQIQNPARWKSMMQAARTKIEGMYGVPLESAINMMVTDGDQVDNGTISDYQNTHLAMASVVTQNIPLNPTIGNHESSGDSSYTLYKGHFRHNSLKYGNIPSPAGKEHLYYAYQVARVVFIHMNTEYETNSTQQTWIQNVVTAVNNDPAVDFIVTVHHRPYNTESYVGDVSPWFRDTIMPFLANSPKMCLDFAGHHHLYARGQTRDWPIYHMIAGGSAWDQYWGQSTDQDMDNIQKTVCNWTWQLLDFDLAAKKLTVTSYSEGGPKLGPNYSPSQNTVGFYTSKLVDTFHRQMGLPVPNKPSLAAAVPSTITLPYTFQSSAFSTAATGETLNSTQFQFSTDSAFSTIQQNKTRDYENLYLDTGSPNYLPVDQHANVNILDYTIPTNGIPNGTYYLRLRHRDSNAAWSAWSAPVSFTVTGSVAGNPSLALDKRVYSNNESIQVNYQYGPGNATDWVGIYKRGDTPGNVGSTLWSFVNANGTNTLSSGTLSFSNSLTQGAEYYAAFFVNDTYQEIAPRVPFYVGKLPVLTPSQSVYPAGATVTIAYSNAPANSTDWIGIYKVGNVPGSQGSTQWTYLGSRKASGSKSFAGLANGYYFANYFVNDGYTGIVDNVRFTVGSNISQCTVSGSTIPVGSSFTVSYSNGPGVFKDYVGIFFADGTPGGTGPRDKIQYYVYPNPLGAANATVTIPAGLPADSYKAALYTNDSYTAVSNQAYFNIQ